MTAHTKPLAAHTLVLTPITSGFFLGRTPLISLSPKKTWEGFLGAFISTLIWGFFFAGVLVGYPYMTCPLLQSKSVANVLFLEQQKNCTLHPIFQPHIYSIPPLISELLKVGMSMTIKYVKIYPLQFHALIMAAFASLIAPFGGFFASGIKRAFNLKDFGDSIPGHGGLTDRYWGMESERELLQISRTQSLFPPPPRRHLEWTANF